MKHLAIVLSVLTCIILHPATGKVAYVTKSAFTKGTELLLLECECGQLIQIQYAGWGHKHELAILLGEILDEMTDFPTDLMKMICDWRKKCQVKPTTELFGKPSSSCDLKLEVQWACINAPWVENTRVDLGAEIHMKCPKGYSLKVHSVYYGSEYAGCVVEEAQQKIEDSCNECRKCSISASEDNSIQLDSTQYSFFKECSNTAPKYLEVSYSCETLPGSLPANPTIHLENRRPNNVTECLESSTLKPPTSTKFPPQKKTKLTTAVTELLPATTTETTKTTTTPTITTSRPTGGTTTRRRRKTTTTTATTTTPWPTSESTRRRRTTTSTTTPKPTSERTTRRRRSTRTTTTSTTPRTTTEIPYDEVTP